MVIVGRQIVLTISKTVKKYGDHSGVYILILLHYWTVQTVMIGTCSGRREINRKKKKKHILIISINTEDIAVGHPVSIILYMVNGFNIISFIRVLLRVTCRFPHP